MMVIDNKFQLGQSVFLKTDIEQHERIVTQIVVNPNRTLTYELSAGVATSTHYECEISDEINVEKI